MIVEIEKLQNRELELISASARNEGYNHIDRLISDYESCKNRFDRRGEKLIGYKIDDQLVAVCGLNIEPGNPQFGRIRRLYVLPEFRNQGVGTKLVKHLIRHAAHFFSGITVNIGHLPVEEFYLRLGFKIADPPKKYSHVLIP